MLATAAVVALIVASVLVDLPTHTTVATDTADQTTVMKQINTALAGCSYGVKETFTIYQDQRAGTLTASDRSLTPSMLRDDQTACSFTSSSIYDLSNVQGTGTPAGKNIGLVVNVATLWATSDALAAIEDIQTLSTDPANAKAIADLPEREAALAQGRAQAFGDVRAAEHILHAKLPAPDMPRPAHPRPAHADTADPELRRAQDGDEPPSTVRPRIALLAEQPVQLFVGVLLGLQPPDQVPEDHRDEGARRDEPHHPGGQLLVGREAEARALRGGRRRDTTRRGTGPPGRPAPRWSTWRPRPAPPGGGGTGLGSAGVTPPAPARGPCPPAPG